MSTSLKLSVLLAVILAFGLASVALAQGTPTIQASNSSLGQILTDSKGMTLYMFTKDTAGTSNCSGGCATAWPPLTVPQGTTPTAASGITGKLGTTTRADGTIQVTYNDMPLYFYAKDKAAGDVTGQDVGQAWYVINPATGPVKTAAAQAATPAAGATTGAQAAATPATAEATTTTAQGAATTAPAAGATSQAPATMPTTGGDTTSLALPIVALAVVLVGGALSLKAARRS